MALGWSSLVRGTTVFCIIHNNFSLRIFFTGKFIVTCLPKLSTKGLTEDDVPKLTEHIRKQMLDCFNQTSLETTQSKLANH